MPWTPTAVRQRRKAQVERRELHLDAAFLLPVGEGLLHAVEAAFIREFEVLDSPVLPSQNRIASTPSVFGRTFAFAR